MCIESTWIVYILIADVHFKLGKSDWKSFIWLLREVVITSSASSWTAALLFLSYARFYRFSIVSFVTTTLDHFLLQSHNNQAPINVFLIRLNFKLYGVFFKWSSTIDFLFLRRQKIINCFDLRQMISTNCHKWLVPKTHWSGLFERALFV